MSHKVNQMADSNVLSSFFTYNGEDAERPVVYKVRRGPLRKAGDKVGWRKPGGYIVTKVQQRTLYLHRIVWSMHGGDLSDGMVIDHIDGNPSNNLIENLQQISPAQNSQKGDYSSRSVNASSGFRGVHFHKRHAKWKAQINIDGKRVQVGAYVNEIDAAKAYDKAAMDAYGRFAVLNFPS